MALFFFGTRVEGHCWLELYQDLRAVTPEMINQLTAYNKDASDIRNGFEIHHVRGDVYAWGIES
jgi:hypothetical protein